MSSASVYRYLERSDHRDAVTVHGYARRAAAQLAHTDAQAHALTRLGSSSAATTSPPIPTGRPSPCGGEAGEAVGEAYAVNDRGFAEELLGRYDSAAGHFRRALTLRRTAGNPTREANPLTRPGIAEERLGSQTAAGHIAGALLCAGRAATVPARHCDSAPSFDTDLKAPAANHPCWNRIPPMLQRVAASSARSDLPVGLGPAQVIRGPTALPVYRKH